MLGGNGETRRTHSVANSLTFSLPHLKGLHIFPAGVKRGFGPVVVRSCKRIRCLTTLNSGVAKSLILFNEKKKGGRSDLCVYKLKHCKAACAIHVSCCETCSAPGKGACIHLGLQPVNNV